MQLVNTRETREELLGSHYYYSMRYEFCTVDYDVRPECDIPSMYDTSTFEITLVEPSTKYQDEFLHALDVCSLDDQRSLMYLGDDVDTQWPYNDFDAFVRQVAESQLYPKPGWVNGKVWWARSDNAIVGRIGLRLELNDFLREIGGHIGYITVPTFRGLGVATSMLRQVLLMPDTQRLFPILLTCDEDNVASERVIVKCGGRFERFAESDGSSVRKKRFIISSINSP
ncbi:MAG TPA: hypothetical protein DIS79_05780 [Bacteroidetes bacterium]|nr:hypothetical protein [Bacteroidota bacterium]